MSVVIWKLCPAGTGKIAGQDASHAWLAVFVPDVWVVDFDPNCQ
ncbi:MAG: hypothetical protein R3E08_03910 [Thiotrichaceae bacterium]